MRRYYIFLLSTEMLPIVGDITTGGWVRLVGVMVSRGDGWSN